MKNFTKMLTIVGIALFTGISFSNAQFGCGSAVVIADGYTATGITTPGSGGIEDWNVNPTGTSVNASYWDDDVYLFEYTAGAAAEQISMTINSNNTWTGIGIFDDCTGTTFSNELDAVGTSASGLKTVSAIISAGNTVYIAVGQYGTPNDLDFDVTNFSVSSCLTPSALLASNITATSADLGWTENGSATSWNIEWGVAGFTPTGTPTIAGTSNNPEPLIGLSSATDYEYYVQADCGGSGTSVWVGPFSFTTLCGVYTPVYTEDFTTYVPNCWEEGSGILTTSSTLTMGLSDWGVDQFGNTGSNDAAEMNIYTTGQEEWLISPSIDITGGPFQLKYDVALTDYNSTNAATMDADDSLVVVISTDNGATWSKNNIIQVYTSGSEPSNTGQLDIIDLSAYMGVVKIGFYAVSYLDAGADVDVYIDNFAVEPIPSCPQVSGINALNIMQTSLDLAWTENGSAAVWDVEYGVAGFTPTGTPTIMGVTNPVGISMLTAATMYDFYVRADCGGDVSFWTGPFSTLTACEPFGDDATAPLVLTGTNATVTGNSSICFTDQSVGGGFSHTAPDVWYEYTLDSCIDSLIVSLCGSGFDTYLTLLASDGTTVIAFNDDNSANCGTGGNSHLEIDLDANADISAGDLIYIVVDGYNAESGMFTLNTTQITSAIVPVIDVQTACGPFTWNGMTYPTSGMYSWTGMNAEGCDSIVTLDLTINTPTTFTDVQTACDSIVWNGATYMTSGTYTWVGMNAGGCDSTVTLDLTIINATVSSDVQTACDSFLWNSTTYTTSGIYTWTGTNAVGCDSVVTLDLTINNSTSTIDYQTVCDSFLWNGTTYTTSGIYTWTGTNAVGCDSTITLELTVFNSSTSTEVETACISFDWNGTTYTTSGAYTWTGTNSVGCDSVVTLDLTINAVDVTVTNNDPSITANATGATYAWLDCDNGNAVISGETGQTFVATVNGNYAVEVTENGCVDTSACTPIVTVSLEDIDPMSNVSVYPNPVKDIVNVEMGDLKSATIRLLDLNGKVLFKEERVENSLYTFEMNQEPGVYFIEVRANDSRKLFKLVKE